MHRLSRRRTDPPIGAVSEAPAACSHRNSWGDEVLVSVLILNWNGGERLHACINSVHLQACRHVEIVIVDNASKDASVALATESFPQVRVIRNDTNLQFSRAYN